MNIKILLAIGIVVMSALMFVSFYIQVEPSPQSSVTQRRTPSVRPPKIEKPNTLPLLIQEVNAKNSRIRSFSCDDVTVKMWKQGMRFRVSGDIQHEKNKRFRMIFSTNFGKELDLGSSEELFWYWSRRDKDPGIHWANHEDYHKTRLKSPFNPIFMIQSLGLGEIDQQAIISETENDFVAVHYEKNGSGQEIMISVFVNKNKRKIDGLLVTDTDGNPIASAEIKEFRGDLPFEIVYIWYEEDGALQLNLNNPEINAAIHEKNWAMPSHDRKLNMADDI